MDDLVAYAQHAKRKTVDVEDVVFLMQRQVDCGFEREMICNLIDSALVGFFSPPDNGKSILPNLWKR